MTNTKPSKKPSFSRYIIDTLLDGSQGEDSYSTDRVEAALGINQTARYRINQNARKITLEEFFRLMTYLRMMSAKGKKTKNSREVDPDKFFDDLILEYNEKYFNRKDFWNEQIDKE